VVLDLRLPDMTGFEVLEKHPRRRPALADVPVVVFTGRELSRRRGRAAAHDHGAQHRRQGRRIARAAARRDRALPASRRHRPAGEKQRMLERLHSSDEDLVGRKVLVVDDDARNIFALRACSSAAAWKCSRRPPAARPSN
jgi:CheY-like chemotaxis protein